MRIRLGVSPDIDTETMGEAINAALEASAISQVPLLANGKIPDIRDAIEAGKVKWKPEPPGDEHFDDAKTVLRRGWGDCDDLAPWLAASLRASGEKPDATPFVYQSGPRRWHAVVDDGEGHTLDPSRWAGMGKKASVSGDFGLVGAVWAPMFEDQLAIAVHPHTQGWAGRVDIPDETLPLSWSTIAHHLSPRAAAISAIQGACGWSEIAGDLHEDDIARLQGLETLLLTNGDVEAAADALGDDYVGFLPMLAPAAAQLAAPMANQLLSRIPGMGMMNVPGIPLGIPVPKVPSFLRKGFGGLFGKKKKKRHAPPPPSPTVQTMLPSMQGGIPPGATVTLPGGAIIVKF